MDRREWVLWGRPSHQDVPSIKITGGSLAHCARAYAVRESEGQWSDLTIKRDATPREGKRND